MKSETIPNLKLQITYTLLITISFIACKKVNESTGIVDQKTPIELLSANFWVLDTAYTVRYWQNFNDTSYDIINECYVYYVGDTNSFFPNGYSWVLENRCTIPFSTRSEPFFLDDNANPNRYYYSNAAIPYIVEKLDAENFDIKYTWITSAADSTARVLKYSPI